MQTWQLLHILRHKRPTFPFANVSSLVQKVHFLSTTTPRKQEQTSELDNDNAEASSIHQPKLKGKQRWRARQRELREASERADNPEKKAANTSGVEQGIKKEDGNAGQVRLKHTNDLPVYPKSRVSSPPDLPKPSHLRPSPRDILRNQLLQKHVQRPGPKTHPGGDKLKESMKVAPFQTAFAQNPYAHILASPVREDILSRVHLPMSCLLAFHIAELDQDPKLAETNSRNKAKRERDRTVQYQLLPLSLAAELSPSSPRNSNSLNHETRTNKAVRTENQSLRPTGNASYLSANYDALAFISKDTKRRLIPFGLSRRMHHEIGINRDMQPTQVKWRPDMPDFVLGVLRSIVAKKLGYLLKSKGGRDRPGLVYEVLGGGHDLRRLHHMEDVSCVIRLTANEGAGRESEVIETTSASGITPQTWRDYSFLDEVMPLPYSQSHAQSPSELVPYRNINIPIYSTHALLGTSMAKRLVARTIFAEGGRSGTEQKRSDDEHQRPLLKKPTKYVVLTRSNGTLQAQIWLSKLQGFISNSTIQQ